MSRKVYENSEFVVLSISHDYLVLNKKKPFESGHTHLKSFETAKWLMRLSRTKTIPHRISPYLLESLIRISNDNTYVTNLKNLR